MPLSRRSYSQFTHAHSWEEIWEAGPYYQRISDLLETAHEYAIFVGWQIDSRLPFFSETLKTKVIRLCERNPNLEVYFLMWDHAFFYILEREAWQGRIWEGIHPRVHFVFDSRHPYGGSHHEKIAIIDGRIAFCGGIDLCDERWDTEQHLYNDPRRSLDRKRENHGPYHDLAVQVTGPICATIQSHVAERWRALTSIPFPSPRLTKTSAELSGHPVYFSQTLAHIDVASSRPAIVRQVEFLFRDLILSAKKLIILEGQYYWSEEINELLIKRMREFALKRKPGQKFRIVLVLAELSKLKSLTRKLAAHELRLLEKLQRAAHLYQVELFAGCPYVDPPSNDRGEKPKPIYVHSKVLLIDDRYLSIGSANFASRAFRVDTEVNITLEARDERDREHIKRVARQIQSHWGIDRETRGTIWLKTYHTSAELRKLSKFDRHFPWKKFFDPSLPYFYFSKRKVIHLARKSAFGAYLALLIAWFPGVLIAVGANWNSGANSPGWIAVYSAILFSVWLVPIPFTLVTAIASIQLGSKTGGALSVWCMWLAAIWGYSLSRTFPWVTARYYGLRSTRRLKEKLGERSFDSLVGVLLDPRVSVQSKIIVQGLFSLPFAWFAIAAGIVVPGSLYLFSLFLPKIIPASSKLWIQNHPGTCVGLAFAIGFAHFITRTARKAKDGEEAAQDSFVQYPQGLQRRQSLVRSPSHSRSSAGRSS